MPHAITREDTGLRLAWAPEGHDAFYPARELRLACRCAACVEEMSGRPLLDPASIAADVRPASVALVGGYGLRIRWSDGHDTGIYTFEQLRDACPCAACAGARAS
jgi:ATP-binding protein involved in chromosome partitioning